MLLENGQVNTDRTLECFALPIIAPDADVAFWSNSADLLISVESHEIQECIAEGNRITSFDTDLAASQLGTSMPAASQSDTKIPSMSNLTKMVRPKRSQNQLLLLMDPQSIQNVCLMSLRP